MTDTVQIGTRWLSVAAMNPIDVAELLDKKDVEIARLEKELAAMTAIARSYANAQPK